MGRRPGVGQQALELDVGLCQYGKPGASNKCQEPATHAAVWHQAAYVCGEGSGCPHDQRGMPRREEPERSGRLECCRDHVDYFASSWERDIALYPHSCRSRATSVWIEVLAR